MGHIVSNGGDGTIQKNFRTRDISTTSCGTTLASAPTAKLASLRTQYTGSRPTRSTSATKAAFVSSSIEPGKMVRVSRTMLSIQRQARVVETRGQVELVISKTWRHPKHMPKLEKLNKQKTHRLRSRQPLNSCWTVSPRMPPRSAAFPRLRLPPRLTAAKQPDRRCPAMCGTGVLALPEDLATRYPVHMEGFRLRVSTLNLQRVGASVSVLPDPTAWG